MGTIKVAVVACLGLAAATLPGAEPGSLSGADAQECDSLHLMQLKRDSKAAPEALIELSDATPFERDYMKNGFSEQIYGDVAEPGEAHRINLIEQNNSAKLKSRLILHHIWKVGGTHLCSLARESGLRAAQNPGCHRLKSPSTPDVVKTQWRPCAVVPGDEGLARIPFDVVGHECAIDEKVLDQAIQEGFAWVGMIRDPVQQAYSWFAHARGAGRKEKTLTDWLRVCSGPASTCGFFTLVPNLQTRWLSGGHCFTNPENEGCVEKALANLRKMAVVLEQNNSMTMGTEKLAKLGWIAKEKPSHFVSQSAHLLINAPEAERAHVAELQHIDIRLLKEARAQGLI